ncbi:MAG: glycosyl hydrolase [Nitrospirae bacterium]|nr:MAG: glycosyl hydrolase [Nitrospirota bacterium]
MPDPKFIAFYLTQFHPTPENDEWWGKGFTEWTNVTKALPLFEGHYQPHLPSDLGFYDLRVRETRREQIRLAKQYGIDGFCYHYYWFSGTRLLHKPLDDMLADPASDMPFCLCWANENWTKRWDGAEQQVLIKQKYLPDDDLEFIKSLVPFFRDKRYIRINGAPLLIVYRPQLLPNPRRTAGIWREYCERMGIGSVHLCAALTYDNEDYRQFGFDSGVEFPPHNHHVRNVNGQINFYKPFTGNVMLYHTVAQSFLNRSYAAPNVFRCVFPSWDNTARRDHRAVVILNGTPANYEYWLAETIRRARTHSLTQPPLIFINAWNEWAEGCHLEPDRKYQRGFLEATLRAKKGTSTLTEFQDTGLPSVSLSSARPRTFFGDLSQIMVYHMSLKRGIIWGWINQRPKVKKTAWLIYRMWSKVRALCDQKKALLDANIKEDPPPPRTKAAFLKLLKNHHK